MAEVAGMASWALDEPQRPVLEREQAYQKEHAKLIADLKEAAMAAAERDFEEINFLVHAIGNLMEVACRIAKHEFLKREYGVDDSAI